ASPCRASILRDAPFGRSLGMRSRLLHRLEKRAISNCTISMCVWPVFYRPRKGYISTPRFRDAETGHDTPRKPPDFRFLSLVLGIQPSELLNALPGVHLGGIDVALVIDRNVMQRRELPSLAADATEATHDLLGAMVQDTDFAIGAVGRVDELLLL